MILPHPRSAFPRRRRAGATAAAGAMLLVAGVALLRATEIDPLGSDFRRWIGRDLRAEGKKATTTTTTKAKKFGHKLATVSRFGGDGVTRGGGGRGFLNTNFVNGFKGLKPPKRRPIMHTFFADVKSETGMTAEGNTALLEAWEKAWQEAGWETKVLTMDDARRHRDFDVYEPFLSMDLWREYNTMCFWRWFAMAASGGGWMADYDTFPLHHVDPEGGKLPAVTAKLPNGGDLTVYSRHIPCLVSGRTSEWDRVARLILERAMMVSGQSMKHYSDMLALADILDDPDTEQKFRWEWDVIGAQDVFKNRALTEEDCMRLEKSSAIHFSHHSINIGKKNGVPSVMGGPDTRWEIATRWTNNISKECSISRFGRKVLEEV